MKIVYDIKLKCPACAILQIAMGGDAGIANHFDSCYWLVNPTPDMKCYSITDIQLEQLIRITTEHGTKL